MIVRLAASPLVGRPLLAAVDARTSAATIAAVSRTLMPVLVFAALATGCYQAHERTGALAALVDAGPRDASVTRPDAPPPEARVCPSASVLGSRVMSVDVVTTFTGCDDRCIVTWEVGGADRDVASLETIRERALAFLPEAEVDIGPCCPSRPGAGQCLVVRGEPTDWLECGGAPAFPEMWMFILGESEPGCFAVRVER